MADINEINELEGKEFWQVYYYHRDGDGYWEIDVDTIEYYRGRQETVNAMCYQQNSKVIESKLQSLETAATTYRKELEKGVTMISAYEKLSPAERKAVGGNISGDPVDLLLRNETRFEQALKAIEDFQKIDFTKPENMSSIADGYWDYDRFRVNEIEDD